jgi:hypothetical protein
MGHSHRQMHVEHKKRRSSQAEKSASLLNPLQLHPWWSNQFWFWSAIRLTQIVTRRPSRPLLVVTGSTQEFFLICNVSLQIQKTGIRCKYLHWIHWPTRSVRTYIFCCWDTAQLIGVTGHLSGPTYLLGLWRQAGDPF